MSYQESLDYLYGLQKFGIKLGLENIRTFLSRLGHPEARFKTVLVAGTNGKGSISSALAEILSRSGYRTGLYTSPHLHTFTERIRINGELIPEERIVGLVDEMRPLAGDIPLTFFEFTTALALQFFAEQEVDIAILEVGLGGRLDATNAVNPILSVIAPVAFDHQAHLGTSLPEIAAEKAGIMRASVPVVSARQQAAALQSLEGIAAATGTAVLAGGRDFNWLEKQEVFTYHGIDLELEKLQPGIPGRHQYGNMATALAAAEVLQQAGYDITPETMRSGVEHLCWPGRLEWFCGERVLLDGAHNGAAAKVLGQYLEERGLANVHWIVGMKADKNVDEILGPVLPHTSTLYCVEPPVEEAVSRDVLASAADRLGGAATVHETIDEALRSARLGAGADGIVLVAGSLFLVAAVRELLLKEEECCCAVRD